MKRGRPPKQRYATLDKRECDTLVHIIGYMLTNATGNTAAGTCLLTIIKDQIMDIRSKLERVE